MKNTDSQQKAVVIGAGFSGLSAASHLASKGFDVRLVDKNRQAGGRARTFSEQGFMFDMGPSWYWMPDVFESFFAHFGAKVEDYYELQRLSPSYRVFFENEQCVDVPSDIDELYALFESFEKGSAVHLREFLEEAEYKYRVGMQDLVYMPGRSLMEYADRRVFGAVFKLHMLRSFHSYVSSHFKDSRIIRLLEFPVLFLGAHARNIPAMYSMMNYADMILGTWYPKGGMHRIVEAMVSVAKKQGVQFDLGCEVQGFGIVDGAIRTVRTNQGEIEADVVLASADYHHIDQQLLPKEYQSYTADYWSSRTLAPSSLIYYVGIEGRVDGLLHHNLFFDRDFDKHSAEIYDTPQYPSDPLFYLCVPSKTDATVAPEGCENFFVLIPTAPGIADTPEIREHYFQMVMKRIEERSGQSLMHRIVLRRDYAYSDFVRDYNSFKGNAYGLANTLSQTAILKPSMQSKKLRNLYYAGQLTVPGPGVPPSLVSGQIAAQEIHKDYLKTHGH